MMRKSLHRSASLILLTLSLSGCSTIHFDRGQPVDPRLTDSQKTWHHVIAADLVEVSDPVNPQARCGQRSWQSVKTETTFFNGLASSLVNVFGPIWYPQTVVVECNRA